MNAPARIGPMRPADREPLLQLLHDTGSFREEEISVALELFDDACAAAPTDGSELHPDHPEDGASYRLVGLFTQPSTHEDSGHAPRTTHHTPDGSGPPSAALSGYACYGPTPGTVGTFDLYWIAVHPSAQGTGGGRQLLREVEDRVTAEGGRMLIVETSSRADYEGTRRFYDRGGYREGARVRDFYAPQDDRVIYTRRFPPRPVAGGVSRQ